MFLAEVYKSIYSICPLVLHVCSTQKFGCSPQSVSVTVKYASGFPGQIMNLEEEMADALEEIRMALEVS